METRLVHFRRLIVFADELEIYANRRQSSPMSSDTWRVFTSEIIDARRRRLRKEVCLARKSIPTAGSNQPEASAEQMDHIQNQSCPQVLRPTANISSTSEGWRQMDIFIKAVCAAAGRP